jgi:hypothetical protein
MVMVSEFRILASHSHIKLVVVHTHAALGQHIVTDTTGLDDLQMFLLSCETKKCWLQHGLYAMCHHSETLDNGLPSPRG